MCVQAGIKTTTTTRPIMPNSAAKPHQMATEMKFYSHKIICTIRTCILCVCVCSSYAARLFCCCIIVFVMCRSTHTHTHTQGTQHKSNSGMYELFWGTLNFCFYILIILMLCLFFGCFTRLLWNDDDGLCIICVLLCNSYY